MDSKLRPTLSQGNNTSFVEHNNTLYGYDPKYPNMCRRYEFKHVPKQTVLQSSTSCSDVISGNRNTEPVNAQADLSRIMQPLPPVMGVSQQPDSLFPGVNNRIEQQAMTDEDQQIVKNIQPASGYHTLSSHAHALQNLSRESVNRPIQRWSTTSNPSMAVKEMVIDQGQVHVNSGIGNQYEPPPLSHASQLPALRQSEHSSYVLVAESGNSQQRLAESVNQPRQSSPSESLRHSVHSPSTKILDADHPSKLSFDMLWKMISTLFNAIQPGSLQLYTLKCNGYTHAKKTDYEAASFCSELSKCCKNEGVEIVDDSKYTKLLVHLEKIKEWLQDRAENPVKRLGKIGERSEYLIKLYKEVKNEAPLPQTRAGPLPESYWEMIKARGIAFNESERGKKNTSDKNKLCEERNKFQVFNDLGASVDEQFSLLKSEHSHVQALRKKFKEERNMDKISEHVKKIEDNWDGVKSVNEHVHSRGAEAIEEFKERKTFFEEAAGKDEPRVRNLLKLIQYLRELISRETSRLKDLENLPAPSPESTASEFKLGKVWELCEELPEADQLTIFNQLQQKFSAVEHVPDVVQASALPKDRPQSTPQFAFNAQAFDRCNSFQPQTINNFTREGAVYPYRKRYAENGMDSGYGEEKRLKESNQLTHCLETSADGRDVSHESWNTSLSYTPYATSLAGSMPPYNLESPGYNAVTLADQLQTSNTGWQQSEGQLNPINDGCQRRKTSFIHHPSVDTVPQLFSVDNSQDVWAPQVPMEGQDEKGGNSNCKTYTNSETNNPEQPCRSSSQPEPPTSVSSDDFGALPVDSNGNPVFLQL